MPGTKPADKPLASGPKGSAEHGLLRQAFAVLGPGVITGAADDDPSGISTYSVAGAAYGYATLWIALLTFPLMAAVQLMCARLGMVTGQGLAAAVRDNYPRWVLWGACSILVVANVINIGADLGSDATHHGDQAASLDSLLCVVHSWAFDMDILQADCADF
jgi:Mn2+/Fe2+ NRAMP family transporter